MNSMTLNQVDALFQNIATAHYNIQDYFYGLPTALAEKIDSNAKYPILCVVPMQTVMGEQVDDRTYQVMVFDLPSKDKTDTSEILSDTEQVLKDVLKVLKNESQLYELVGEPILIPEDEVNVDWITGYRSEIVLRTAGNTNYCDIPSSTFVSPNTPPFAVVKDQDGNTIATLYSGDTYNVIVASGILDDLSATVQIIDNPF